MCTLHFYINTFWATVYKMVRPVLSDRCLSCPVLTVTFVYCEQTVGWIKLPLGVEVVLDPGHTALNGDPAPPMEMATTAPTFEICRCRLCMRLYIAAHVYCGQTAEWIRIPLGTEVGLGPGNIVLDGDPTPPPFREDPNFGAMNISQQWFVQLPLIKIWHGDAY